jgi:hypothetical protein
LSDKLQKTNHYIVIGGQMTKKKSFKKQWSNLKAIAARGQLTEIWIIAMNYGVAVEENIQKI